MREQSGLKEERGQERLGDVQMLNDPLHDTKVVHHLHKGDEKYDSAQNVGKEPGFVDHCILIEKEDGTDVGFLQEVGCEESKPLKNLETGIGLEDEEGDDLLEEETNNDRLPDKR
jgi:hypothetical protein